MEILDTINYMNISDKYLINNYDEQIFYKACTLLCCIMYKPRSDALLE